MLRAVHYVSVKSLHFRESGNLEVKRELHANKVDEELESVRARCGCAGGRDRRTLMRKHTLSDFQHSSTQQTVVASGGLLTQQE